MINGFEFAALAVNMLQFSVLSESQIIIKGGSVVAKDMFEDFLRQRGQSDDSGAIRQGIDAFSVETRGDRIRDIQIDI
jgi:hypothetical protein